MKKFKRGFGVTSSDVRNYTAGVIHKKVGPDFPGETFCVLKEKEECGYGKYRTRRLERIGKRPLIGCD